MDNKYNVSLLIEDNFISEVFKEEINQVKEKLQQLSNIKEFNTYTLTGLDKLQVLNDNHEAVNLVDKKSNDNETHMVLVISDNNSVLWNNKEAYDFLNALKEHSLVGLVAYERLDPLKERSIEMETKVYFDVLPNAKSNKDMKVDEDNSWGRMEDYPHGLFLPSARIDNVDELLNGFMNHAQVDSVMIYDNIHHENFYKTIQKLTEKNDVTYFERKLNKYKCGAGVNGYQLAAYFSIVDSFTVSDMKFVQQHMLPESTKQTLMHFALSSMVDKVDSDIDAEQRYKIKQGLCPILHRSLRDKDANAVELLLKEKNTYMSNVDNKNKLKI